MSVLLIDSDGELNYKRQEELGVDYISMPYCFDGKEYYDDLGKNTETVKAFYTAVRKGSVPKTMALNPEDYKEILEKYWGKGEDILYVSFSHAMSGTFNHLQNAAEELKSKYPQRKIEIFDTKSISLGAGIQMEYAAELKNQGKSDEEIVEFLKGFSDRIAVYFMVDNLMHLKRGGRLSSVAAVAGTLLGLKPVLTISEKASLSIYSKVVGRQKALRMLADKVVTQLTGTEYHVYVVDADCPKDGDFVAKLISEKRSDAQIVRQTVGPVVASHCGPGTVGVIFVADKRPIPIKED